MYVFVTFDYSFNVELVVSELQKYGFGADQLLAVPLQPFKRSDKLTDMMSEDATTLFDYSLVLGTILMLLGVIYGNVLAWGPILWGLIGLIVGGIIGLIWKIMIFKKKKRSLKNPTKKQVILMIRVFDRTRLSEVETILKPYIPTGYATVELDPNEISPVQGG